jgi:hypothetical protein
MTNKQRIAAKELVENGGNMGIALKKVGYSDSIAKNPYKVVRSKGFQDALTAVGISDEKLAFVLNEGLEAHKLLTIKDQVYIILDYAVIHKYLETILKLKGQYKCSNYQLLQSCQ